MPDIKTTKIDSFDGEEIAVHEMGNANGRPLFLIHGLFSTAYVNWIKYGHAQKLADAGLRVIMPDLRAHGESASPQSEFAYPEDVIIRDNAHIIRHYGFDDYDLGGFSLGARTTASLLADGLKPRKAMIAGMGYEGMTKWADRRDYFLHVIAERHNVTPKDPHFIAAKFFLAQKMDATASSHFLNAIGNVDLPALEKVDVPILVLIGDDDHDNGSAKTLAEKLPNAQYEEVPGNHMACITHKQFGDALVNWFAQ